MPTSKNYFAIPAIVVLTLFSVKAHSDCPEDTASILLPGGSFTATGEIGTMDGDVAPSINSVRKPYTLASNFRNEYDGNSIARYSSDIALNDQRMSENVKGDFGSSTMGCMEEVVVTAVKLTTSKGIWWFIGGSGVLSWLKNKFGSGGEDVPGDPVAKAPHNPGNNDSDASCQASEIARRVHVNRGIFTYLQQFSAIGRVQLAGTQVWVLYNSGDSELWTIVDPSGMNDDATGSEAPIICKPKP